ncbi:MAG: hypothetical protein WKF75_02340 [Singulisphaera sp.]
MTRLARLLAPLLLALTFGLTPSSSRAQPPEEPVAEEEGSGNPVPGYLATGLLGGLILFIVAKSARR